MTAAEGAESRFEATLALAELPDLRALQVYLRGLTDKSIELRKASAAALAALRDQAAPVLESLARRNELPPTVVPELRSIYAALRPSRAGMSSARLRSRPSRISIPASRWRAPPHSKASAANRSPGEPRAAMMRLAKWSLGRLFTYDDNRAAYGYAEIESAGERQAQMAVGSDDTLTVWVNGKEVYEFSTRRGFEAAHDRFDVMLQKGTNRILVRCENFGGAVGRSRWPSRPRPISRF